MRQQLLQWLTPNLDMARLVASMIVQLTLAAVLGGIIGWERETKHKPAGLRTNMFICFGAAMFTILSDQLAARYAGDHTRIAAQIIPGIGFIGAGSILHSRGGVTGLTTAATLFVVASIGMAVGGGLYFPAMFATLVIFLALHFLGWVETRMNLKPVLIAYEVTGPSAEAVLAEVNRILEDERKIMQTVQVTRSNSHYRVQFTLDGTYQEHQSLLQRFRSSTAMNTVESLGTPERE